MEITVPTPDGWELAGVHHAGRGRGVVLCGHAIMASSRSFERGGVPARLATRGFEVYNFDLRGHGRSRPAPGGDARWNYDDLMLRDVPALVGALRERHPGLPLAVVGHSLVGHGCLAWLGQEPDAPVDAVVAVAANVWLRRFEPSAARWLRKRAVLELWAGLARPLGRFPARRLRLGTEDVSLDFIRQFVGWSRSGKWTSRDGRDYLAGLPRVRRPVLAVLGGADRLLCVPDCGRAFAAELGAARVEVWEVGRDEIPGLVPDHMRLVTDPRAAPLWDRVAGWLDATLAPPGRRTAESPWRA